MPARSPVPDELRHGPFHLHRARALGVTKRATEGSSYVRVMPRVYRHRDHEMSQEDWRLAATLTMPVRAVLSHVSALQDHGIDVGRSRPVHLTVSGDLHLAVPDVFLHRTRSMPENDGRCVSVEAAMVGAASMLRPLDVAGAADMVVGRGLSCVDGMTEVARREPWRAGAKALLGVLPLVRAGAEARRETFTRLVLEAAELPEPLVNVEIRRDGRFVARVDLLFEQWRLVIEYDGRQHLTDVRQWNRDIVRDQALRDAGYEVLHVTHEMLASPRALVLRVHEALRRRGYAGPPPVFGPRWAWLVAA
ncbi:DUF559 domain-containing protein [Solicola sp. PLA-1-18]|uniref:endonuclease domain-containing protein n=1 Tax=Solicola sp. PLA-1-18 TaxID=3380532 RepID=UPI003B779694